MTKEKLQQYIREYNKEHEEKCICTFEGASYVLLKEHVYIPAKEYNGITTNYYNLRVRKFHTLAEAEQYIKNEPWQEYFDATAKIVSYDYLEKEGLDIPKNFYTGE